MTHSLHLCKSTMEQGSEVRQRETAECWNNFTLPPLAFAGKFPTASLPLVGAFVHKNTGIHQAFPTTSSRYALSTSRQHDG